MIRKDFRFAWPELVREGISFDKPKSGEALAGIETTSLSFRQGFICMAFAAFSVLPDISGEETETDLKDSLTSEPPEGELICRCLLCESRREEEALLNEFRNMLKPFSEIRTYAGKIFSMRFLNERWILYSDEPFFTENNGQCVLDIYEALRPFRSCLPVNSLRKKEAEALAGFERRDPVSGREIAQSYQEWENTKEPALKRRLLDHLKEDALSLLSMGKLLALPHLFDTSSISQIQVPDLPDLSNGCGQAEKGQIQEIELLINAQLTERLPFPVRAENQAAFLEGRDDHVRICIRACRGRFKHFLQGAYKDYYYLPQEDLTVHKSLAQAVDKSRRVKATARTCFLAREGIFLPAPPKMQDLLLWSREYGDEAKYVLYEDESRLKPYLFALLRSLIHEIQILLV